MEKISVIPLVNQHLCSTVHVKINYTSLRETGNWKDCGNIFSSFEKTWPKKQFMYLIGLKSDQVYTFFKARKSRFIILRSGLILCKRACKKFTKYFQLRTSKGYWKLFSREIRFSINSSTYSTWNSLLFFKKFSVGQRLSEGVGTGGIGGGYRVSALRIIIIGRGHNWTPGHTATHNSTILPASNNKSHEIF